MFPWLSSFFLIATVRARLPRDEQVLRNREGRRYSRSTLVDERATKEAPNRDGGNARSIYADGRSLDPLVVPFFFFFPVGFVRERREETIDAT